MNEGDPTSRVKEVAGSVGMKRFRHLLSGPQRRVSIGLENSSNVSRTFLQLQMLLTRELHHLLHSLLKTLMMSRMNRTRRESGVCEMHARRALPQSMIKTKVLHVGSVIGECAARAGRLAIDFRTIKKKVITWCGGQNRRMSSLASDAKEIAKISPKGSPRGRAAQEMTEVVAAVEVEAVVVVQRAKTEGGARLLISRADITKKEENSQVGAGILMRRGSVG